MELTFGAIFAALLVYFIANTLQPSFAGWIIISLIGFILFLCWIFGGTYNM